MLDRWNHDRNNFESDEFHETQRISEALQRNAENLAKSLTLSEKAILDQYQIGLKLDFAAEVSKMKLKSRQKSLHYFSQVSWEVLRYENLENLLEEVLWR